MNDKWDVAAEMLGLKDMEFFGGVERCDFTLPQLANLIEIGLVSQEHRFNNSPTVRSFLEFGKRAEEYGAKVVYEGFLESKARENARLVVEGVRVTNFIDMVCVVLDFSQSFHNADEFTASAELLRAWYD